MIINRLISLFFYFVLHLLGILKSLGLMHLMYEGSLLLRILMSSFNDILNWVMAVSGRFLLSSFKSL